MDFFSRFDLSVNYILSVLDNNLNLELAVNNVFNEDIRSLPNYPEPGQNWTISINYTPKYLFYR